MQPHEQHDGPEPKPDPRDTQAIWLLLVILILLGLIAFQVARRLL
jgi:hypothetical protein